MWIYPNASCRINPSRISVQNYVYLIPVQPSCASTTTDTALDAIGVAINGVAFFNQYAAGYSPLTSEIISFDQYNGHPARQGNYHYHATTAAPYLVGCYAGTPCSRTN